MMNDVNLGEKELYSAVTSRMVRFMNESYSLGLISDQIINHIAFALFARHIGNVEERNDSFVTDRQLSAREKQIWQDFQPSVKELKSHRIYRLFVGLVEELFNYDAEEYEKTYASLIDNLFSIISNQWSKGSLAANVTPDWLLQFFARYTERNQCTTFYNPFAGFAGFAKYLHPRCSYYGQEINNYIVRFARLRLDAYNMQSAAIECTDSVGNWESKGCDCIVTNMPWGVTLEISSEGHTTYEQFFFQQVLQSSSRMSFGIYPCNILWNTSSRYFGDRKRAIASDLIDTIIQLPGGVFLNTSIPSCIIITNREKANPNFVRFIDASSIATEAPHRGKLIDADALMNLLYECKDERFVKLVPNEEVLKQDANLQPSRYLNIDVQEDKHLTLLGSVVEGPIGTIERPRTERDSFVRVIHIANLASNAQEQNIDFSFIQPEEQRQSLKRIDEDALLLSRVAKLKPTIYKNIKGGILLHPNVIAFRVDTTRVLPEYLAQELSKDYISKQIGFSGALQSFSLDAIKQIKIIVPSIEEQRNVLLENAESQVTKAKQDQANLVVQKEQELLAILGMRQHSMNGLMERSWNSLNRLQKKIEQVEGNFELVANIREIIGRMQHQYSLLYDEINDFTKPTFGEAEIVDLVAFLKTLLPLQDNYKLTGLVKDSHNTDYEHAYTKICVHDLQRMVSDIMRNAEKHGFVDAQRKNYYIDINLEEDVESNRWIIDFSNNGKPLPSGINKMLYGIPNGKAGENAGKGQGGATVRWTTEHFGGDYDVFTEERIGEVLTIIRIILPKYDTDE